MDAEPRGPMYGLSDAEIVAAAHELAQDVRTAVAGIDASHVAEDDVNADACGAMRKTLARVCSATSYYWEIEPVDHRARRDSDAVIGETHIGADIGFILYDSPTTRVKVILVQAKRLDRLRADASVWPSLLDSCNTIEGGIATPGGWAWIYQQPTRYETTAFSSGSVRLYSALDDLLASEYGRGMESWFTSVLTCYYGSITTSGHVRTWVERHRPRRILAAVPATREGDVGQLLAATEELNYRAIPLDQRDDRRPG